MFLEEEKCTGCMACKNICPRNAIRVKEKDGFCYPEIIEEYCIGCNLCEKACPVCNYVEEKEKKVYAYACKNNNEKIRMESSSGGVFTLIASWIINSGGVVYGVAFNEKFETEHVRIDQIEDLSKLRGSKYIQSKIGSTMKEARKDLLEGRKVLFTGTPCQIEGIQTFLGKDYDNLYLQDLICHGVPSKKIFEKYMQYQQEKNGEIEKFSFRNKENKGWNNYQVHIVGKSKEEYIDHSKDSFMNFFLTDIALRESCYQCNFKKKYRNSDITLADFWGINEVCPEMNDEKGTSLVIVNSEKGKKLFEQIENQLMKKEVLLDEAICHNKSMIKSVPLNEKREELLKNIDRMDYEELVSQYIK